MLKLRRGTKETSNATPSSTQNYQTSPRRLVSKEAQTKTFNPLSRHANIASLVYNINTNQTGDTNTCLSNQTGSSSQTSASASWASGQSLFSTPSSTDRETHERFHWTQRLRPLHHHSTRNSTRPRYQPRSIRRRIPHRSRTRQWTYNDMRVHATVICLVTI